MRALNDYLAAHDQYHVQIVDPNIPVILVDKDKQPYLPYVNGKASNLYVRHPANDTFLFGKQWPAVTIVWPDWTNPAVPAWWEDNFRRFGDIAGQLGGVWLDMNEPSNFCDGQISASCQGSADSSRQLDPIAVPHPPVSSPTDIPTPPYQPPLTPGRTIESGAFNISSHLYYGQSYNVKDMWGMMEQRATAMAMANIHKTRPFTLSRSTFMGSGQLGRTLARRQQQQLGRPPTLNRRGAQYGTVRYHYDRSGHMRLRRRHQRRAVRSLDSAGQSVSVLTRPLDCGLSGPGGVSLR